MTPAFGYLRVSGKSQLDGDGFPRQRLAIEAYAAAHGIEIVRWFEERAVPGATEFEHRPAWMDMISSLNGVRTIVVEALHRLARDMGVQEFILRDLNRREIELHSTCEQDVQNPEPTRVLFRQMIGAIAQYEKTMIVLKTRAARERIRAAGRKCEGAHAFGHHPEKPEEKRVLDVMTGLRAGGMSTPDIAATLNRNGFGTRLSGEWHAGSVARILRRKQKSRPSVS